MREIKTVKARETVFGDGVPKICIPVTAENKKELKRQIERILEGPCQMIEWRVDYYQETEHPLWLEETVDDLRKWIGELPLLFTFRTAEEGGERSIPMMQYAEWNLRAVKTGKVDFVDLELNRGETFLHNLITEIHSIGGKVIISFHDFGKTPEKEVLIQKLLRMQVLDADISKAAVMPEKEQDVLTLLEASLEMKEKYADRPYITMSMGATGGISRLAGSLTGSALTFATAGRASAPGQMDAFLVEKVLNSLSRTS